jgi:single-stranded-DNA-specific exonuclease
MAGLKWILPDAADAAMTESLAGELSITPFVASLLVHRGFRSAVEAEEYLHPRLKSLRDPFALPAMRAAVDGILAAVDKRKRIVLYGDYDVDGVTSLALLTRVLRAMGAKPDCFLPMRMDEGYGLSAEGLKRCISEYDPQLLIAADCGTSSVSEIAQLKRDGMDVIVLDHHECKSALPECVALVNPKIGTDYGYLCSVGIVFKVCHALLKLRPVADFDLRDCLDLVALGTVADIVPLVGENRILVKRGLEQLANTKWPGVRALMDLAGVRPPLRPSDIGFRLGPRLNAAGRLGAAKDALELLLTGDEGRARTIAASLEGQNRERQAVEMKTLEEAEQQLGFDPGNDAAIVVGRRGWHPGVLGIVASRISKAHHRPAIVIGFDETGTGKGSGRSIEGFSLVKALNECAGLLEKFGGHEMAAGLTIAEKHFKQFREQFLRRAREMLSDEDLRPRLRLDCEVALDDLDFALLAEHELLQPFGVGNWQPLFFVRGVAPSGEPRVLKEKHLRLTLRKGHAEQTAIFFGGAEQGLPRPPWDVAFRIERNEFRDTVNLQMQIQQLRRSQ